MFVVLGGCCWVWDRCTSEQVYRLCLRICGIAKIWKDTSINWGSNLATKDFEVRSFPCSYVCNVFLALQILGWIALISSHSINACEKSWDFSLSVSSVAAVHTCGLCLMSSHLINCLSRLHCSYLFISRLRQTPKGAYPNSSDVNNSVSMWVSTNKYNPQNPRLFVCVCFQVKWKTRAHLCDSCGFLFTEQENLVISFKIWANMRVYIGLTNVVSLSFTTLETKKLYACVCVHVYGWPLAF